MIGRKLFLTGLASAMALTLSVGCQSGNQTNQSGGDSPATGGDGKTLVIYSGRGEKLIGELIEKAKKDLNLDIQVRYGGTSELTAALLEEGDNSKADVFFGQDAGALGSLEQKQRTIPISTEIVNKVDERFRSPSGNWLGISGRARVIDYNTKALKPDALPKTVWELTEPQWKGKVGWAPTNGSFQSFITAMRVIEGDEKTLEWLKAMKANDVKDYGKNSAIVQALGRGEVEVGLVNHYYLSRFTQKEPDFPVAHHFTNSDPGAMINVAGVSVLKTTDQQKDAEAFINYLLSDESQKFFLEKTREYSLTKIGQTPEGQVPLTELNPPQVDLTKLSDLEGTLKLLQEAGVV